MGTDEPSGPGGRGIEEADTEAVIDSPSAPGQMSATLSEDDARPEAADREEERSNSGTGSVSVEPGAKIGRFLVTSQLGAGGMGVVLAAQDPLLDRKVAVKLLRPRAYGEEAAERARNRLLREAQAMAKLSHPNVLPVYDAGDLGDQVFIAMELVDGVNLGQWLKQEGRSWREVLDVFIQAGRGLVAAHRAGLVHRDFKPENVLVGRRGSVRVADFGLVGTSGAVVSTASLTNPGTPTFPPDTSIDETLTHTGTLLGTPCYMAPEQHLGEETDTRADQFSYCIALYQALYGQRPFAVDTYEALSANVLAGNLRKPPTGSNVPTWVRDIVERGLSRARDDRYPSMKALLADLEHDPAAARRRRLAVAGIAAAFVALAAGLVFALTRSGAEAEDPCAGVDEELDGIWDDEVKAATKQALLASGREHAQETCERVVKLLDEYASSWIDLRIESCKAARGHGAQADQQAQLRAVCLAQRRDELEAATSVLTETPDGQIADKAILFALELTPLETCTASQAIPVMLPLPGDATLRNQVTELRKQLARARIYRIAGKPGVGLSVARPALSQARALGYAPLEAESLLEIGLLEMDAWEDGTPSLEEAVEVAQRARHDAVAAKALVQLIYYVEGNPNFPSAKERIPEAEAAIERAGGDERLRARLLQARSWDAAWAGRYDECNDYEARALADYEDLYVHGYRYMLRDMDDVKAWLRERGVK